MSEEEETCRYPSCSEPRRGKQEGVSVQGAKYCSDRCMTKWEHIKADARDAKRSVEQEETREEAGEAYWRQSRGV